MNSNPSLKPQTIVIVLGMHRSGTSCLTGSLQQAGLELGDFSQWNPHNLKGNRENNDIVALNDKVLQANGGSWDAPPRQVKWPPVYREQARQILSRYAHNTTWGFKDPRTLLTLEGWLAVGINPQYIGIFRNPLAVANSIKQRSLEPIDHNAMLELWYAYNKRLLAFHKRSRFPLLCFDWPEEIFHNALDKALINIGLHPTQNGERFYSAELVNQSGIHSALPRKVNRLYRQLRKISEQYQ